MGEGFVHAEDGQLVDGGGRPLILRGVGLGNWLLPEGYMWKFEYPAAQSPRQIEALIEDLVGQERAAAFWTRFRDVFISEDDVATIAAEGMNHVRLPINSRVVMDASGDMLESGLELIDRLIGWCRDHRLWVVLDLHGAPGGQTGTHIDDSPNGAPDLFTDPRNRELTITLWRALAERYRDETVVAAYDLLNEPLPHEHQLMYSEVLRDLYLDLTAAIRAVDPNHAITYEGTHWATNWDIFTEAWDQNSILQFHKYWSAPDRPSIQGYIDVAGRLGLPVYMGEGGENYLDWIQTAFQLYDDCGISWSFWPWKKVDTFTSPCSVNSPAGWNRITEYAAGRADRPPAVDAERILDALLEAMPLEHCTYNSGVISALFRRPPLNIPAVGFGFRGRGVSYEAAHGRPLERFRRDDLVSIRHANGLKDGELDWNHEAGALRSAEGELVVGLGAGDWVAYELQTTEPTPLQVAVESAPAVEVAIDGVHIDGTPVGPLPAGSHVLRLTGVAADTVVSSIEVTPADLPGER